MEVPITAALEHDANISMCGAVEGEQLPEDFADSHAYASAVLATDPAGMEWVYQRGGYGYWVVWGKLIRKEILEKLPLTPGRIYEDNAIVCQWLHEAKQVAIIDGAYYFYWVNPIGTTKSLFDVKNWICFGHCRSRSGFTNR